MEKAIVTRATGFIRRWMTRELVSKGVEVYAVVRKDSRNLQSIAELSVRIAELNISELTANRFYLECYAQSDLVRRCA